MEKMHNYLLNCLSKFLILRIFVPYEKILTEGLREEKGRAKRVSNVFPKAYRNNKKW